jgi:FkbM family methyltransferase
MKILPSSRFRRVLICIGFILFLIILGYLFKNDRYKASGFYQIYKSWIQKRHVVLGLYKPIDFRVNFFGMIYEGRSGNILDDAILYYGAQEKYILFFMKDVAETLGKDVVFYDIGANVGQHSLFMSKYVKEVHAFEPYPPVLERFRKMVAINRIKNIYIHPVGLGNKNGQLPFYEPPESNLGAGSFIKREDTIDKNFTMPLVIGDEWLEKKGASHVDIIKCDIEGYEKNAFLGLKQTLSSNRPIVVMELNLGLEESFQSIDDFYATFPPDYELLFFCITDDYSGHYELCQYDRINFGEKKMYYIVVYPKEKKRHVKMQNEKGN